MKLSGGFNANHLRSRSPGKWRWRFCAAFCGLLTLIGILLLLTGIAMALGESTQLLAGLGALEVIGAGIVLIVLGIAGWRRCRRRNKPSGLDMAPGLLK
jgi:membrane protein implicated in regulation of membrane protease activity